MKKNQGDVLVKYARKHLGKPYVYGARTYLAPAVFDCSSFVQYLYKRIGIDLPRRAIQQALLGRQIPHKVTSLEIGDLMFFKGRSGRYNIHFPQGIGHVAVNVGDGKVIHSRWLETGDGSVVEEAANELLSRDDLVIIKRIL